MVGECRVTTEGVEKISAALIKNCMLQTIDLGLDGEVHGVGENYIQDDGAEAVATMLQRNNTIKEIHLGMRLPE